MDSGQLGPFTNAYWGHSAYKLPPEANLMAAAHYIEALRLQAKAARMMAIFGGKNPHPQFLAGEEWIAHTATVRGRVDTAVTRVADLIAATE